MVVGTEPVRLSSPTTLIVVAAVFVANLTGILMAVALKPGIGLLVAVLFGPLALLALPLAIALWVPLVFIADLPIVSIAPSATGLLIALAWIGTFRVRRAAIADVLYRHRRLVAAMLVLLVWVTLSLAWAAEPGIGAETLLEWYPAALAFVVIATTIARPREIRLIIAAFVVGAALSVTIGLANGGLDPTGRTATATATATEGRLQGGSADPNYLAADLVPALVLAGALAATTRDGLRRSALGLAGVVIIVGFGATQSRGGLVAAVVAAIAALVLFKRRRLYVALALACVVSVAGAWFAANPGSWTRISQFNGGGNGRSEIWLTAWRITQDHPVVGVGLNNFRTYSPRYARRPGALQHVQLIADRPHVVHNTYLQMLVETGVIGLGLFLGFVLGCLRALWLAAKRFDTLGDQQMSMLSRCVLVGVLAQLTASFFISNGTDLRMWLLFGLGPALLSAARLRQRPRALTRA